MPNRLTNGGNNLYSDINHRNSFQILPKYTSIQPGEYTKNMSCPILSSATRRLSAQPICHRSLFTSRPASNLFSVSSDTPASRQSLCSSPLSTAKGTRPLRCHVRRLEVLPFAAPRHRAAFTSSSIRPASRLVQNARTDEEGNSLTVDISARAAEVRLSLSSVFRLCLL